MANALIYATAICHHPQLITSDSYFADVPGVTLL
jgi:hypothetical protein